MRRRLTFALSVLAAVAVVILAIAVYALIRQQMIRQLDHALEDKLRFFRAFCMQKDGTIGFSMSKSYWQRIRDREDPEFFEYRFQNGTSIRRSASLEGGDLPLIGLGEGQLEFADVTLPGDRRGRCAGLSFHPEELSGDIPAKLVNIVVAHDGGHIWSALERVRVLILTVGGGMLVLLFVITGWIVRSGMRPLKELSEEIDAMPVGESARRFAVKDHAEEIRPVIERLNELMNRVADAIRSERQFTSNAAHELRNPIAGLMAQLEIALADEQIGDDVRETLAVAQDVSVSLHRTVENLLQLARLEAGSERIEREPLDVAQLLRVAWKPLFAKAEDKRLRVSWELGEGIGAFETSKELLRVMIANLFENAVEYVDPGGQIEISARRTDEGGIEISVANSAESLDADDVRQLFDRFWRSPKASPVSHGHSGIGLSLCEKIATALLGTIGATLDPEGRLRVTFVLPSQRKNSEVQRILNVRRLPCFNRV